MPRVLPLAVRLGVPRAIPKVGIALLVGFSDSGIAIGDRVAMRRSRRDVSALLINLAHFP